MSSVGNVKKWFTEYERKNITNMDIPHTPMKVDVFLRKHLVKFTDKAWKGLLKYRGYDLNKKITLHVNAYSIVVKQWDIPAGD